MITIDQIMAELARRRLDLMNHLYPDKTTKLRENEFPWGHKLFENTDTIFARENYTYSLDFWKAGSIYKQRLLMAGNRIGKTVTGAFEVVCHLTGLYPEWWEGRRFTTCNDWWVVGKTHETVIEILQPLFLGRIGHFGTGLIPKDRIDFDSLKDAKKEKTGVGTIRVRHSNGTYSSLTFKSYEQGRGAFEGTAKSIYLDEEPPVEIYAECLTRTLTGGNILMMTFTPLQAISDVVKSFLQSGNKGEESLDVYRKGDIGHSRYIVRATMDDVLHLTEKDIQDLLASYPPHQRSARRLGIPTLEGGAIFPVEENLIVVQPFELPKHWPRCYGMDVGRNTAASFIAMDPESRVFYIYSEYFNGADGALPSSHAQAVLARGKWLSGAIDTSAHARGATDGENLFQMYQDLGLRILNADKAVEAGLYEMLELMAAGRLKVFSTCTHWLKEFRSYRRDDKGRIVKEGDHLMDATRYGIKTRDKILRTEAEAELIFNPQPYVDPTENFVPSGTDSWMLN